MALIATSGPIPKGAVALNPAEALHYQWQQIHDWPYQSEVWPFKWGIGGLAVIAAAAGGKINKMYRIKLKLRNKGFITTSLPTVGMPAMMVFALHTQFVTGKMFLQESNCPLCLQGKSVLIQTSMSIFYPIFMTTVINFQLAAGHGTYRVPYYRDMKANFALWWKFTKPMSSKIIVIGALQTLGAIIVTYFERRCLYNIQTKLEEIEASRTDGR